MTQTDRPDLVWHSQDMGARVDLDDKQAIHALLDRDDFQIHAAEDEAAIDDPNARD